MRLHLGILPTLSDTEPPEHSVLAYLVCIISMKKSIFKIQQLVHAHGMDT